MRRSGFTLIEQVALTAIMAVMLTGFGGCGGGKGGDENNPNPNPKLLKATNGSYPTQFAEEDNVNVPITGEVTSFLIEAIHPGYNPAGGNCDPNFGNAPPSGDPTYPFAEPGTFKLLDNGTTVLDAVREATWWRPKGMAVSLDSDTPKNNIHYLRLYRKISGTASWPQFLVLYMDGNLRLKPQPPQDIDDTCFGSSVIIGPAAVAKRPLAEIVSVRYLSKTDTLEIVYADGSSATLKVETINRALASVRVTFNAPTTLPLVTFRSMFVAEGNADADHVKWKDASGTNHDDAILTFASGESTQWLFCRNKWSTHNTSAPDIKIRY